MTYWLTVKWVMARLIPGVLFMLLAIMLFRDAYSPSQTTLQYLYSSIFQGLAALVAVTLAIVLYISDRLEKSMDSHLADARRLFDQFFPRNPVELASLGYEAMTGGLRLWFADRIEPICTSLDARFSKYRANGDAILNRDSQDFQLLVNDLRRMESYQNPIMFYQDAASHLGRFKRANNGWLKLPKDAILAFGWSFSTIAVAVVLLAGVDSPGRPSWAIVLVVATLLAVIYLSLLFRTLFRSFLGDSKVGGFAETGLTDPRSVLNLYYEVRFYIANSTGYLLEPADPGSTTSFRGS